MRQFLHGLPFSVPLLVLGLVLAAPAGITMRRRRSAAWQLVVWATFGWLLLAGRLSAAGGWAQSATPVGGSVTALAQSQGSPPVLYAGTESAGVLRSGDGGTTWDLRAQGLPATVVCSLAVDPRDSETVFAVVGSDCWDETILRTRNGGADWVRVGPPLSYVGALVFDRSRPRSMYAATFYGLLRSLDEGETWEPAAFDGSWVAAFAINPRDDGIFFAAVMGEADQTIRIWKSSNRGRSWERLEPQFYSGTEPVLVFDPARPGTLYLTSTYLDQGGGPGTLFKIEAGGASWTTLAPELDVVDLAPATDGALYAATPDGVWRSTDGGRSWLPRLAPQDTGAPPYDQVVRVVASPDAPRTVYAAGRLGAWKSIDGGRTWNAASRGISVQPVYSLAVATDDSATVFASLGSGVFRSVDQGNTWRRTHPARALRPYSPLAVAPSDPQRLYGDGLRSDDGGQSWSVVFDLGGDTFTNFLLAQAVDPRDADTLYLGGFGWVGYGRQASAFLLRSRDGGATWTDINSQYFTPVALAIDPRHTATLYAISAGTVFGDAGDAFFKSLDAGATWTRLGGNLPLHPNSGWPEEGSSLAIDPSQPDTLYAGTPAHGVWKSADGGATFSAMNCGLEAAEIDSLIVDPADHGRLYAGVTHHGVWRWRDPAKCWEPLNDGLPVGAFSGAIAIDARHAGVLYAATESRGIWRLDLE